MNLKVTIVAFSGLVGKVAVPVTDLHSTTQVKPFTGGWMQPTDVENWQLSQYLQQRQQ
jgi:hypothetical protein